MADSAEALEQQMIHPGENMVKTKQAIVCCGTEPAPLTTQLRTVQLVAPFAAEVEAKRIMATPTVGTGAAANVRFREPAVPAILSCTK